MIWKTLVFSKRSQSKHVESLPDTSLSFKNLLLETICQTQIYLFGEIGLSPQTSKLSYANGYRITRRTMDDYRNSLTIKFCADVFAASWKND